MKLILLSILGKRIRAIPYMMRDKSVPVRKKAIIIAGLIFLFLPFKLFPPVLFIGGISNLIVWLWIILYLKDELDKYWNGEKPQDFSKRYRNKTVINDVDFEIKNEE